MGLRNRFACLCEIKCRWAAESIDGHTCRCGVCLSNRARSVVRVRPLTARHKQACTVTMSFRKRQTLRARTRDPRTAELRYRAAAERRLAKANTALTRPTEPSVRHPRAFSNALLRLQALQPAVLVRDSNP
jgi:hypothetical protein